MRKAPREPLSHVSLGAVNISAPSISQPLRLSEPFQPLSYAALSAPCAAAAGGRGGGGCDGPRDRRQVADQSRRA
jgi:hypothetical protein